MAFSLTPTYGKQNVPVFKVQKPSGKRHEIVDMVVSIMLEGDVAKSWLTGENSQILPTETQKNTCYAIALETDFRCIEQYALALGRDILSRHRHLTAANVEVKERVWRRVMHSDGRGHNHAFMRGRNPTQRRCRVRVTHDRTATRVASGIGDVVLMKTAQSGFKGFIQDKYTNLKPVGAGTGVKGADPDRILCTELEGWWTYTPSMLPDGYDYKAANARVLQKLLDTFCGPPMNGRYSLSLQDTAYCVATAILKENPAIAEVSLATPNVHFYTYPLKQFGLLNPNVVFQSTDCHTTASGRICTLVRRGIGGTFSPLSEMKKKEEEGEEKGEKRKKKKREERGRSEA